MHYLITLEDLETRYTSQWRRWIRNDLDKAGIEYFEIDGDVKSNLLGANFLDPCVTNIYKSEQIIKLSRLFEKGQIEKNDIFLFYDAWHPGIISLRYMSILKNIPIKIYGMWHAGSYDPQDLLGQMDKKRYLLPFEQSLIHNLDKSFVATNYHKKMMIKNLKLSKKSQEKILVTGFPYNFDELNKFKIPYEDKENIVVFPHRLSKEKNPELLKEISKYINGDVIFCQENKLSKDEYHKILAKSKVVFSASTQETWGIGIFEGLYFGCVPVIPNRLSYSEMYNKTFRYNTVYENSFHLALIINKRFENHEQYINLMKDNIIHLKKNFCTFKKILNILKEK